MTLMRSMQTIVLRLAVLLLAGFTAATPVRAGEGAAGADQIAISGIELAQQGEAYTLRIRCSTLPAYTVYELPNPQRLVLDIDHGVLQDPVKLPLSYSEGPITLIQGQNLTDKQPPLQRLELLLAAPRSYAVNREGNDILIAFTSEASTIEAVEVERSGGATRVLIRANGMLKEYHAEDLAADELYPARMYIDFKKAAYAGPLATRKVGGALKEIRMAKRPEGVRMVFDSGLAKLFSYEITPTAQGLAVVIAEPAAGATAASAAQQASPPPEAGDGSGEAAAAEVERKTAASHEGKSKGPAKAPEGSDKPPAKASPAPADSFTEAGYVNQRITVDFYKIDLHNVFRLIGEISGRNIIVDEGVGGTLTLALSDVPWDFALDVILNLKDLQKEERFNTIIIAPKAKNFQWPEHKLDNLAVKADGTMTTVESLSVQKRLETPREVIEARQLLVAGRAAEERGEHHEALDRYEQAFAKWPQNGQLADRLASLCLAQEGMNAKALYYAREALKLAPKDQAAALYAAISSANMGKKQEARDYFEQAVAESRGNTRPPSEALLSYAVFQEQQGNYATAMQMLTRHEQLYGDNLDTMVARARIADKEGNSQAALAEYQAILNSGFALPSDLNRYIKGRMASQESGVRSQESEVRSQKSEIRNQD